MRQCFSNLAINAVDAMSAGGRLTIRVENTRVSPENGFDLKDGSYLKISFTDEGIGISEEDLSKVFEPYFSTKPMSAQRGSGLGLAVCHSVVQKHGG